MEVSPSTSAVDELESSEQASTSDLCLKHKVTKLDTLAGLAIRYNVSVSDIKRANGLLSDTGMWAREELLIPKEALPIGEDARLMVSQILSGAGRDPILDKTHRQKPGSSAAAFLKTRAQAGSGSYEDEGSPYSRRSGADSSDAGDVELMERVAGGTEMIPNGEAGGYGADRVRRRKAAGQWDEGPSTSSSDGWGGGWLNGSGSSNVTANQHRHTSTAAGGAPSSAQGWSSISALGRSIGSSSIVQKIKQAAAQPALAKPNYNTFSDAADAVITSLSTCGPTGTREAAPMRSRAPSGSTVMQRTHSSGGFAAASAPRKHDGKSE